MPQNAGKNLSSLAQNHFLQTLDQLKISNSKYWLQFEKGSGQGLIILSKNFNSGWKVLLDVSKKDLNGSFLSNIKLLKKARIAEDHHFVVNGYANLWTTENGVEEYGIVFFPQIIADIGTEISKYSIILLIGMTLIWKIKKYISSR